MAGGMGLYFLNLSSSANRIIQWDGLEPFNGLVHIVSGGRSISKPYNIEKWLKSGHCVLSRGEGVEMCYLYDRYPREKLYRAEDVKQVRGSNKHH